MFACAHCQRVCERLCDSVCDRKGRRDILFVWSKEVRPDIEKKLVCGEKGDNMISDEK